MAKPRKRLIVCCDGTWQNSDDGYVKRSILNPEGGLQVPTNVTRISRCFKRTCSDGVIQIISYQSGVGSSYSSLDRVFGGAFGAGISDRVREAYSFICANYSDGDEIILIGFSRGAFTARSVAGMIADLGLLTREGSEHFYPIFKDMENWMNNDYEDEFPTIPFADKPKGPNASDIYRARLVELGYTRDRDARGSGDLIRIKAVGGGSTYQFWDTTLSDRVAFAFQALALDETRPPFSPTIWERVGPNAHATELRQVWFAGNHSNCGGGWPEQGSADLSLAWMMDQLASVNCEFDVAAIKHTFQRTRDYYEADHGDETEIQWAIPPIFESYQPIRPWGLAPINQATGMISFFAGRVPRTPGMYRKVDPVTEHRKDAFLQDTNERIHSSVRVRLALKGLGLNDEDQWKCPALKDWRLRRAQGDEDTGDGPQWVWEFNGPEEDAPPTRVLPEERLGNFERLYLDYAGGSPNVLEMAEQELSRMSG